MDDDIDIEEHDVLDNPRIKSMFPDLSRVKIEVPDDEEMEDYNSEGIPEDGPQIQLVYQYEYNTITETDESDQMIEYENTVNSNEDDENEQLFEIQESEQTIDELEAVGSEQDDITQEGMYVNSDYSQSLYIPNKIMVGSRPSQQVMFSYETLYEEALNSQAIVYLENWGQRLEASPCYCGTCKTLFSTINALDAHKMVSHSYLIAVNNNTARKSTASAYNSPPKRSLAKKSTTREGGRLCNHCNNHFPDDTTLIKHLYELLPMNNYSNDGQVGVARNNSKVTVKIPTSDSTSPNKKVVDGNFSRKVPIKKDNVKFNSKGVVVAKPSVVSAKIKKQNNTKSVAIAKQVVASLKIATDGKRNVNVENRKPYFKCSLCHDILNSKNSAQRHRVSQHPTFKKLHIFHKLYKTESKPNFRMKGKFDPSIIPKSILLQCGKCQVHLLSPYSAMQHYIACTRTHPSENCSICRRNIMLKDKDNHYMQHANSEDRIKVYTVRNRNIYERVLCECPKCGVCFEELPFWIHVKSCEHVDHTYCTICDRKIVTGRYRHHEIKHRIRKFAKKDFILIKYFHYQPVQSGVIELPLKINSVDDKIKGDGKTIYYCPQCQCCQHRQTFRSHTDKLCVKWKKANKKLCDKCGLVFSLNAYISHRSLHVNNQFTFSEYTFVNIITSAKMGPPIAPMYECNSCNINFIRSTQLARHVCNEEDFQYCNICKKKFNLKAYSIHKVFHGDGEIMPELLLKYNSLCSTWNLMYMCVHCDVVCLSYDTAVEHSQKHIAYAADTAIYCKICNLTLHEAHYRAHADLHETNSTLTIDSFKILKYNYKRLFHNDWMDFSDLNEQDIKAIISKSVYMGVKHVKMNAIGESDAVKYYCCACKISVDDVATHLDVDCKHTDEYRCRYCKTEMDDLSHLVAHELRHENTNNELKIVTFNDDKDRKLNAKLRKYFSRSVKDSRRIDGRDTEKEKRFKAYCCRKCNVCITLKQNMRAHRCLADGVKKHYCKLCHQNFTHKYKSNHDIAHAKFPSLCKKTLSIVYFNDDYKELASPNLSDTPDPGPSKIFKVVKLKGERDTKLKIKLKKQTSKLEKRVENDKRYRVYCCKTCKVCVILKQNTYMHRCSVKRYYCKHCDQYFSYNFRVNHERAHLNYPNLCKKTLAIVYFGDDEIDTTKDTPKDAEDKYVLYKCQCNIHCDSVKSIRRHTKTCELTNVVKEKCSECGLFFSTKDITSHTHDHNKTIVIKDVVKVNWYQCSRCEILFLTEDDVKKHYQACDPRLGVKCVVCNYNYHRNYISSHRCSENESSLYIQIVTRIEQSFKEITIYSCPQCDIHYWTLVSYKRHVTRYHSARRRKDFCKICKLKYTKMAYERHADVHRDAKEYKIKIINPITGQYKIVKGENVVNKRRSGTDGQLTSDRSINESDRDSGNVTRSRRRKRDNNSIEDSISIDFEVKSKKAKGAIDDCSMNTESGAVTEGEGNNTLDTQEGDGNNVLNSTSSDATGVVNRVRSSLAIRNKNTLYKCPMCPLHYLQLESLKSHVKRHPTSEPVEPLDCPVCHLKFSAKILKKHTHSQHELNKFDLKDFEVKHVEIKNGFYRAVEIEEHNGVADNGAADGLNNDNTEIEGHGEVDDSGAADGNTEVETNDDGKPQENFNDTNNIIVDNESIDASTIDLDDSTVAIDNKNKEIRLFKCRNCNVCFITKQECLQHIYKHVTIDSKYYISCKICGYQFMISSLKAHMEKHHETEFRLENVTIEDYTVVGEYLETQFDMYHPVDRVQSRLISTTTDEGKEEM